MRWSSIPSRGKYSKLLHATETRVKRWSDGPLRPEWRLYLTQDYFINTDKRTCSLSNKASVVHDFVLAVNNFRENQESVTRLEDLVNSPSCYNLNTGTSIAHNDL